MRKSDLTLPELKLLDVYLARIDSHDPEKRTVIIEKGELERVLCVTRILKDDLNKRLRNLFQIVEIEDATKPDGFKIISLFEEAEAVPDGNGLWKITLTCTPSAREYIFNIEDLGYLRYRLKNVIELNLDTVMFYSSTGKQPFLQIMGNKLDDLKELLKCKATRYNQFKFFNAEILKKCHNELNEKTDCHFDYEPVKQGRTIVGIRFTVKTLKQLASEDVVNLPEVPIVIKDCPLWESALSDWKLSAEKLDELSALLDAIPAYKLPEAPTAKQAQYKYIALKVAEIKRRNQEKKINNRFAYLRKLMQKDMETKAEKETAQQLAVTRGTQAFRNFTERTNNNYIEKILEQYKQH